MASHMQVPHKNGEENSSIEDKEVRRAIVNKESIAFPWLSPCWERRGFSSSCQALLSSQGVRTLPSGLLILFN